MAIEFRKTVDEDELVEAFRTIMVAFGEEVEERDIERARKFFASVSNETVEKPCRASELLRAIDRVLAT